MTTTSNTYDTLLFHFNNIVPSDQEPCTPSSNSNSEEETATISTNSYFPTETITKRPTPKLIQKPIKNTAPSSKSIHSKSGLRWRKRIRKTVSNHVPEQQLEDDDYHPPTRNGFRNDHVYGVIFSKPFRVEIIKILHENHKNNTHISINKTHQLLLPMINQYEVYHNRQDLSKYSLFRLFLAFAQKRILLKDAQMRFTTGTRFIREYHKAMMYTQRNDDACIVTRTSIHSEDKQHIQNGLKPKERVTDDHIESVIKDIMDEDEKCIEKEPISISVMDIDHCIPCDDYKQIENENKNRINRLKDISDDYQHSDVLKQQSIHYERKYKELCALEDILDSDRVIYIEMEMGSIVPIISSNRKSVLTGFDTFCKIFHNKLHVYANERKYALFFLTKLILTDHRVIAAESHKFAIAQFITLILSEFGDLFMEIYKCVFHSLCIWCIPYVDKSVICEFDASIDRCKYLKYIENNDPDNIGFEEFQYWQVFSDDVVYECENKYFLRNYALCGVYVAVQCYVYDLRMHHVFGSGDCWRWIVYLLCLPQSVYPELLCVLRGIVSICGETMMKIYPTQFTKIIYFIHDEIYTKCDDSTAIRAKAKREWIMFWKTIKKESDDGKVMFTIKKSEHSTLISQTLGAHKLKSFQTNYDLC